MDKRTVYLTHGNKMFEDALTASSILPKKLRKITNSWGIPFDYVWLTFLDHTSNLRVPEPLRDMLTLARSLYFKGSNPLQQRGLTAPPPEEIVTAVIREFAVWLNREFKALLKKFVVHEATLAGKKLALIETDVDAETGYYLFLIRLYEMLKPVTVWFPNNRTRQLLLKETVPDDIS